MINKVSHKAAYLILDDLSWFDLDALPKNTIPYIKQAIEAIKHNNFYSEFGW